MDHGPFFIFWAILEAIRNGLAHTPVKFMLGGIIATGIAMYFIVYKSKDRTLIKSEDIIVDLLKIGDLIDLVFRKYWVYNYLIGFILFFNGILMFYLDSL